ncbi:MAG: winged helix-turn-helix domain-containing protein [Acidobacteriota bacterium]|nr:winged helix-turn-helix domain-containing protein [Acidobacteriota bacterium]
MRILLVEDDPRAARALERGLREEGFAVEVAQDGEEGLRLAQAGHFEALVLDVMLPKLDGFTLLDEARAAGVAAPVLFLTARDALPDRLRGLEAGGDYLVKPFAFSELVLRLHNLVQRGPTAGRTWTVGNLTVDPLRRRVQRGGERLDLSAQEYALLELLIRNAGHVVPRNRIAEELWEMAFDGDPNLVDAAVRRLRRKVDDPYQDKLIQTRRGVGYALEAPHD